MCVKCPFITWRFFGFVTDLFVLVHAFQVNFCFAFAYACFLKCTCTCSFEGSVFFLIIIVSWTIIG